MRHVCRGAPRAITLRSMPAATMPLRETEEHRHIIERRPDGYTLIFRCFAIALYTARRYYCCHAAAIDAAFSPLAARHTRCLRCC